MTLYKRNAAGANRTAKVKTYRYHKQNKLDFKAINAAALSVLPSLLDRWLPDGKLFGGEYSARNPKRADRHAGSFKVNMRTGRWADFATGDKGGDVISLAAYLSGASQSEAARELSKMLGVSNA